MRKDAELNRLPDECTFICLSICPFEHLCPGNYARLRYGCDINSVKITPKELPPRYESQGCGDMNVPGKHIYHGFCQSRDNPIHGPGVHRICSAHGLGRVIVRGA